MIDRHGTTGRGQSRARPSDRIPVFCNLLDQGARELGLSLEEYYSSGELVAEAQLRMRERYGHDNVWSLFYVGKEAELLGCRRHPLRRRRPAQRRRVRRQDVRRHRSA